jgi:uncharacterized protein DUF2846
MRTRIIASLALAFFPFASVSAQEKPDDSGCGPGSEKLAAHTDKSSHPEPQPIADKAVLVVVRPTMMGNKVQTKFAVDGKWVGVNRGDNYFFVTVDPGSHQLCSQAENKAKTSLNAEAGKIYFVQQHVTMGFMKAGNTVEILDEAKGRAALAKCHLSTFEKK